MWRTGIFFSTYGQNAAAFTLTLSLPLLFAVEPSGKRQWFVNDCFEAAEFDISAVAIVIFGARNDHNWKSESGKDIFLESDWKPKDTPW